MNTDDSSLVLTPEQDAMFKEQIKVVAHALEEFCVANKKLLRQRLADPAYHKDSESLSKQITDINMELWSEGYHCEGEYLLVRCTTHVGQCYQALPQWRGLYGMFASS